MRRHSRRAVVTSHPANRSGLWIWSAFAASLNQVVWTASSASASCSPNDRTVAETSLPYRRRISSQADGSPPRTRRKSTGASDLSIVGLAPDNSSSSVVVALPLDLTSLRLFSNTVFRYMEDSVSPQWINP
jgi:hypothetical protein